jgi:hypothetical protein
MRDAESMLDQVLASAEDPVTTAVIAGLLGLAEAAVVDRFVEALATRDVLDGMTVLDGLEADGRDLVAFSEQVVARLRERLVAELAAERGESAAGLAAAARRLTGIDASRSALGGYRWQLELALLSGAVDPAARRAAGEPRAAGSAVDPASRPVAVDPAPRPAAKGPRPAAPAEPRRAEVAVDPPARPAAAEPRPTAPAVRATRADPPPATGAVANPPRAPSDEPQAEFDLLVQQWPQVVAHVGRNPATRPIVTACRPVELREGVVVLGFPEDQPFLRDHAERKRAALEEGIAAVLGRPVGVRCVVANVEVAERDLEPAGDLVHHARRIFEGDLADIDDIA